MTKTSSRFELDSSWFGSLCDLRNLSKSFDPASMASAGLLASVQYEVGMLEKTGLFQPRNIS